MIIEDDENLDHLLDPLLDDRRRVELNGDIEAMYRLAYAFRKGETFHTGEIVTKDEEEADRWSAMAQDAQDAIRLAK